MRRTTRRMQINDPSEPNVDGPPATRIDTLHRCCVFRDKDDTGELTEFLARSGHRCNQKLWTVAHTIGEVVPDRNTVGEAIAEGRWF